MTYSGSGELVEAKMDSNVSSKADWGRSRSGNRGSGRGVMTLSAIDALSLNCCVWAESRLLLTSLRLEYA